MVAAIGQDYDCGLAESQREDSALKEIITLLDTGVLPVDEKRAKLLALTQSRYVLEEGVLYHVEADGSLRVIPPEKLREKLFREAT